MSVSRAVGRAGAVLVARDALGADVRVAWVAAMTPGPYRVMHFPVAEVRGVVSDVRVVEVRDTVVVYDNGRGLHEVDRGRFEHAVALAASADRWDALERARAGRRP